MQRHRRIRLFGGMHVIVASRNGVADAVTARESYGPCSVLISRLRVPPSGTPGWAVSRRRVRTLRAVCCELCGDLAGAGVVR